MKGNPFKTRDVQIDDSWKAVLQDEFKKEYFAALKSFLQEAKRKGDTIYPRDNLLFNAFNTTPFDEVKVVILGQDPYHGLGQAMGLSFSVPKGVRVPPSLKNIFKEIKLDLGIPISTHGDLTAWAQQGVFLLNAILTVKHKEPGSHKKIGWQEFTDAVIQTISDKREGVVFLFWGNFAKKKLELIDQTKHHVLTSAHPSPMAGNRFFNNHHFSQTNSILRNSGIKPINWELPKMY